MALAAAIAIPTSASAFRASNGFTVNQINNNVFEVQSNRSRAKDGYWCAVGDYTRRALGLDWQATLYVVQGYHKSVTNGRTSTFTLNPPAVTPCEVSFVGDVPTVGYGRSVSTAFNRCRGTFRFYDRRPDRGIEQM